MRVENPADESPNTIDCASCHFATPTEELVGSPLFSFDDRTSPSSFQPDGVNESAAIVEYLRNLELAGGD